MGNYILKRACMKTNQVSKIIWVGVSLLAIIMLSMIVDFPEISFDAIREALALYDDDNPAYRIWKSGNTWRFKTATAEYTLEDLGADTGAGSGDITSVGDVASGAAFDGTQGTTLTFNNAGGDGTLDYDGTDFNFSKLITSPNFVSTVATGTQPYACTSTTLNTNLNAGLVGSISANAIATANTLYPLDSTARYTIGVLPLGTVISIYENDVLVTGDRTGTGVDVIRSYSLAANTYSKIRVRAGGNLATDGNTLLNCTIHVNGVGANSDVVNYRIDATGAGDIHDPGWSIEYSAVQTASSTINIVLTWVAGIVHWRCTWFVIEGII